MMRVPKYLLTALLVVNIASLGMGVSAAAPSGAAPDKTRADYVQDQDLKRDQDRQDVIQDRDDSAQDAQVAKNTTDTAQNTKDTAQNTRDTATNTGAIEDLKDLTGDQQFVLQMMAIIMPLLSLLATGLIAYLQFKAKNERQAMAEEARTNLGQMGRSINGMKTELVAVVKAAAFLEGLSHAAATKQDPDALAKLQARASELAKEAEVASEKAAILADEAVRRIETKP